MNRRCYLRLAASALSGLAGCGSDAPSTGGPDQPATEAPPDAGIDVGVETSRYLIRSFAQTQAQRAIDPEQITPAAGLSEPLRSALEAAAAGGYETSDISTDLLAGVDRFRHNGGGYRFRPYFSLDGTPYAFEPTVPVFVARLETGVEDPDPDRTIGPDGLAELPEPARDFVRTVGAFTTMVPRDEYRISVVPGAVREFLDQYDYVRDPDGVGRIVTERVDPGPPYTIHANELTAADVWGRPVLEGESLPAELRRFVETVVASERRAPVYPPLRSEYRADELPESYGDRLGPEQGPGSGPYVDIDGTVYAFRATEIRRDEIPVAVSATTVGPDSFEVTIGPSQAGSKPAIDGPIELESEGTVPGVFWIETGSDRYLLESDANGAIRWRESEEPGSIERRVENVASASIPEGGEIEAAYSVPETVPPGAHRAWGLVRVSWRADDSNRPSSTATYPFQIAVTVPEASAAVG